MEMLNNIWVALTTENEIIINIMLILFLFIEMPLTMELFLTILNISANKKQKLTYLALTIPIGIVCVFLIPKPYSNIVTLISAPIIIMYVFKIKFLKALCAEFIPVICITVFETIVTRLFLIFFNCTYEMCAYIPIYRLASTLSIYFFIFILYKIIASFKLHIDILDSINKKNKRIILINVLFALIVIFMQMYLIVFYNNHLPFYIILINILSLISYFSLSIYSIIKTMKLEKAEEDLEQEKTYNKTLQILHDNIRAFKHDFANILSGIGGYVETDDMKGLKSYYKQLLQDCEQVSNLESLSPELINSPSVYSVLANKYYRADSLGIKINLDSFIDFKNLNMGIYEFTRILGILMDNAIEAASECDNKLVNVIIRNDNKQHRQLLRIENTYKDKNIDLDKISEKGYSTKPNNTGLGLWEVDRIIKKHKNLARFTTKNDEFFIQQLEIYDE